MEDKLKSTPLGWAARFGGKKLVDFLLDRGANPNSSRRAVGKHQWLGRRKKGHTGIAEILRQHGAE